MEWWSITSYTHALRYGSERAQHVRKRHLTVDVREQTLHQKCDADVKLLALKVFFHNGFIMVTTCMQKFLQQSLNVFRPLASLDFKCRSEYLFYYYYCFSFCRESELFENEDKSLLM